MADNFGGVAQADAEMQQIEFAMAGQDEADELVRKDNIMWVGLLLVGTITYCLIFSLMETTTSLWKWGHYVAAPDDAMRYAFARDIAIMVFFGFGFLMVFLRRYGFSAIGYTLIIGAFTIQQSLLWEALFMNWDNYDGYTMGMTNWINALFCAASIMIMYGVVLGKVTPFQITFAAFMQVIIYWLNCRIAFTEIGAQDMGGSMVIHAFGAYFGVGLTYMITPPAAFGHEERCSTYTSDRMTLLGTLFLWIEYPSFNAALADEAGGITRALMNTAFSLGACVIGYSLVSRFLNKNKMNIVHLQNACLAGGVAIGSIADMPVSATGACIIGMLGGTLCVLGFVYVDPFINNKLKIQDTCGVHNLHGMPGIMCCLISAAVVAYNRDATHVQQMIAGEYLGRPLPYWMVEEAGVLAAKQLACGGVSVLMGVFGGMFTGAILNAISQPVPNNYLFNDRLFWDVVSYGDSSSQKVRSSRSFDAINLESLKAGEQPGEL